MAKAQAFLIISIIFIVIFATLFLKIDIFQLLANKAAIESAAIITNEISNIKDEIGKIQSISYYASDEEVIGNIKNFTEFVRESYEIRKRKVAIVALLAFTPTTVVPNEVTGLNVSIFNERTEPVVDFKLNFSYDGSVVNGNITIPDGQIFNTTFSFNTSSDVNYTLDIFLRSKLFGKLEKSILLPIKVNEKFKLTWAEVLVGG